MPTPTKKTQKRASRLTPNYETHDWERAGKTLRILREAKGVTQAELATAVGFRHHSSITQIELGIKPLTDEKLIAVAARLDIDPLAIRRPLAVTT